MYNPEETYKCRICNLQTKYPYRLQSHLEVHKLKDTLTCAACGIVFQNMKSLTIWHSKNSLKGHLDDSEIIKKTEDCKELLKQNRKSHQNKKTHSSQDKLNVVLFRNGPHSGTGLDSQVEEMEKYSDSWHIVDRETTEEKTDRRNTNDPRLDNSLICPILDNVTNSMMETKMANTDNHSLMKLTKEDSESQTVNIENHKMPELEKEDNNNSVKFQCSQCNFKTKYKNFWKLHKHVHMSKDSVTCDKCNIMFSNRKSLVIWHAKNNLQDHVYQSTHHKFYKGRSRMNINFNLFKKGNKSQAMQKSIQLKPLGEEQCGTIEHDIVTDVALDLSVVKEERTETSVEMSENHEHSVDSTGKSKIAGTFKGHHFSGLDKVYFNTDIESLYCDDLVSNVDTVQGKADIPAEMRMSARTKLDNGNIDKNTNDLNDLKEIIDSADDRSTYTVVLDNMLSVRTNNESVNDGSNSGEIGARMNINFNLFKKGNKSQAMQKSIQLKPLGEEQCGTIEHDIVTDVALDLSVVKEERTETSVEMSENHEHSVDSTGKSKIAGTFKGHHFSGLDKVNFNTDIESLYCDDLVSNVDTVQGKADIPAEMRMSARTKLGNGNIDKNTNDLNDLKEIIDSADDRSTYTVVLDNMLSVRTNNESVNDGSNSGEIGARMNINFNLFKKGNKSQAMQKSIQLKPLGEEQCGTIEHDIVTDVALDLSVVKEERTETSVEMSENHEHSVDSTGKSKIAGTFKGHHFSGLDKVYFNTDIESLYCDDLVSNVDTVQGKADIPAEMRMSARTKLDNGNIDKNTNDLNDLKEIIDSADDRSTYTVVLDNMLSVRTNNESVNDGSNSGEIGANVSDSNDKDTSDNEQRETSSNDKDLNNNEIQGGGCEGNENGELRDENNNINKESGDDGDDNDDSYNENMGSPKHVELLICLVCQTSFSNKVLLLKHLLKVHNLTNLCRLCYFKDYEIRRFANPVSLRNHRLRCHENEMKPCVCGSLFLDDNTLMNHLKKFKCTQKEHAELHKCICGKRFTSEMELDSHRIFKCRKRKLVYSDNGYNSKVIRNSKKRSNYVSEIAETETEPILDNVTEKPTANVKHKKQRNAMRDLMNTNYSTENVVKGNELNKDLNNNLVDDVPMKHKEDAYKNKKENRKLGCKESKFPINKSMLAHRKQRDNKKTVCKACFARYKPCDYFYHQKVCHQKRLATNSMRASGLRSGSMKKFRCGWCRFVSVHWKTVLLHHYSNHQQWELDVAIIQIEENPFGIKPCSVVLQRL